MSLSVTIFILTVTSAFFMVPFFINFSKNEIADFIGKRCCWAMGFFLLILDSTIIARIANKDGLTITSSLLLFTSILNWILYLFMFYLVISTIFRSLNLWKKKKFTDRFG